ncbi:MAG: phosphoribosyl-ATP diphosphatase [Myxococcota bacterium]
MIIPSVDIMSGRAVQLVQGQKKKIDAGDPTPIAEEFGRVGDVAVIDLDAAMGTGSNAEIIESLLSRARCRVGGGIRDVETARRWLDRGAEKIILGTAARPEILEALPRERVIAALDAKFGEVVVEGWKTGTGTSIEARMAALKPYVGGFLITFVEDEGTMKGFDIDRAVALKAMAPDMNITMAGGVRAADEVAALDAAGLDVQVGMALYSGQFDLADALAAMLKSDRPDGLWPTVVVDEVNEALGLAYSNLESLRAALKEGRGVYHSRKRGLWRKGATSGATQALLKVDVDCDRDALRFTVRQAGGFCHIPAQRTCFGPADDIAGSGLYGLARRLADPHTRSQPGSYTGRLFSENGLLEAKLREEADELAQASSATDVAHEAADVIYFTLVKLAKAGVPLEEVSRVLDARSRKVSRRPGNAKTGASS